LRMKPLPSLSPGLCSLERPGPITQFARRVTLSGSRYVMHAGRAAPDNCPPF
jgi:hypothetical protein